MKQAESGEKVMELSGASADFADGARSDASEMANDAAPPQGGRILSGVLGASWGVVLQEILLWPLALAVAFAWML